jgi:uncharacterized protein Usg
VTTDGVFFKPKNGLHTINSFEEYYDLLWGALCRIRSNYENSHRTIPLAAFSTISSGYDSTAVTCLAKQFGVETCFSVSNTMSLKKWSSKHSKDDGSAAAQALDLNMIYVDTSPSSVTEDELFFLATNYGSPEVSPVLNEIAFASMAALIEQRCSAAVLFTGYHGDKVWDIDTPEEFLSKELVQSYGANFGLSEIRLKSGFLNIAIPFILARNIRSIVAISRSEEMMPWRLHNNYDRPIPRRISESFGVHRRSFGIHKKYIAKRYYRLPKSRVLRKAFVHYLKKNYDLSPWFVYIQDFINQAAFIFQRVFLRGYFETQQKSLRSSIFWPSLGTGFLLWIWATHTLSERIGQVFKAYTKAFDERPKMSVEL